VLEVPLCALELSQIWSLAAWSVGGDGALVRTDLATCQMHSGTNPRRGTIYPVHLFNFRLGHAC
jgi:hypothetical protein